MSLQWILGPAGAGKTTTVFEDLIRESMAAPGVHYFALVPEQFTLQTQADIVRLHPRRGTMDVDIVSFERLAFRVFEEMGVPMPVLLDDMGKTMVLRKVAEAHADELGMFRRNLKKVGFLDELKSVLSEFCQYRVEPAQLAAVGEGLGKRPMLQEKVRNLKTLYEAFEAELDENTIPKEELLHVFCRYIPQSEIIRNGVFALDGFTGFTPVQLEVLRLLLQYAKKVTITLTLGSGVRMERVRGEGDLFYMSRQTWDKVNGLAREVGAEVLADRYLADEVPARFREVPMLAALERSVGRHGGVAYEAGADAGTAIRICEAENPAAEADFIAREIRRLVRAEGMRYRELAVVVGSMEGYEHEIEAAFARHEVPCFLDSSRSLIQNSLATFLLGLLEVVERGFEYDGVFRCLKSGFLPGDPGDVDRVENYALARGVRGIGAWEREWTDERDGQMESRKQAVAGGLLAFYHRMKPKELTVRERLDVLQESLQGWGAAEHMQLWQERFEAAGDYGLAKEYEQAWSLVEDLFVRIACIMGDACLPMKEFREVLTTGLEETKVGVIPAGMDQVLVGDMTRSRLKDIHVLFFAGMNDGLVPAAGAGGGVLSDLEREQLKAAGVELKPTDRENSFTQKFYFYLAVTKPDRQLVLSYSRLDSQGKSKLPSGYLRQIEKTFPGIVREEVGQPEESLTCLTTRRAARQALAKGFPRQVSEEMTVHWRKLYQWFAAQPEEETFLAFLKEAGFYRYENDRIGSAVAKALYGEQLSGSVTKLEKYAACAYAWFLQTGLALSEREVYGFEARDMGNLFHLAIELYFRKMQKEKFGWELTEERRLAYVEDCVKDALLAKGPELLEPGARNEYLVQKLKRITDRTIWALTEQGKRGDFLPEGVEMTFSAQDTQAMNLRLTEDEILRLKGTIDRIDVYDDGERCYVKIIDYKSGSRSFDLAAVYYGLQLQLVLYLDAAMEVEKRYHPGREIVPAGVFYYHIDDPFVEPVPGEPEAAVEQRILEQLRMDGLANRSPAAIEHMDRGLEGRSSVIPVTMKDGAPDGRSSVADNGQFAWLQGHVREEIQRMGRAMLQGDVPVHPYKKGGETGCDYCLFRSVCGFDTKIPGYTYRKLPRVSAPAIWDIYEEERERHGSELDSRTTESH